MELTSPSTIKKLLNLYGQNAKKNLGQNFLIDKNVLEIIVQTAEIKKTDHILEVGPGMGVLTRELAKTAKNVTAIELDTSIIPILKNNLTEYDNVEIVNMDALRFSPPKTPYKVVANIPYNITSPLINHFLQNENPPQSITLLIQLEVAEKICEKEPAMSILSLQVALFGKAKIIKKVSPSCFYPPPKVTSAVIQIIPFSPSDPDFTPLEEAQKILKLAKIAFSQKRKKLSNTLGNFFKDKSAESPEDKNALSKFKEKRPQHLSVTDWKKLISLTK